MTTNVLAALAVVAAGAATASADIINNYSLTVLGDLHSTSEVEGRAFVGGNLGGPASNYGTHLTPASEYLGVDVLTVGGNINAINVNLNAGNLRLGGSLNGNVNYNGGGSLIQDASVPAMVGAFAAQLNSTSAFLRDLAATSTASVPNGQPGPLVLNAVPQGPEGVAVFNLDGATLFNNPLVQQIELALNGAQSVIVNVSGSSINWNHGNMVGQMHTEFARSHVLFNFFEATSINLGGRAFSGALLAPNAHLTFNGVIDGSVAVASLDQFGEVHLPTYDGYVPAPGTLAAVGLGLLAMGRRRR